MDLVVRLEVSSQAAVVDKLEDVGTELALPGRHRRLGIVAVCVRHNLIQR